MSIWNISDDANANAFLFDCYRLRLDWFEHFCSFHDENNRGLCQFPVSTGGQPVRIDELTACPFMKKAAEHIKHLRDPERGLVDQEFEHFHSLSELIADGVIKDPTRIEMGFDLA
jgi:hypothetical protein